MSGSEDPGVGDEDSSTAMGAAKDTTPLHGHLPWVTVAGRVATPHDVVIGGGYKKSNYCGIITHRERGIALQAIVS